MQKLILLFLILFCSLNLFTKEKVVYKKQKKYVSFGIHKSDAENVSIIDLIANPDKYHGRNVMIKGVVRLQFESNAIYLTKDCYNNRLSKNALWISLDEKTLKTDLRKLRKYNGKYVLVEGVFDKTNKGHFGMYSGTIKNVYRFLPNR